jgi:hypothetical protein
MATCVRAVGDSREHGGGERQWPTAGNRDLRLVAVAILLGIVAVVVLIVGEATSDGRV